MKDCTITYKGVQYTPQEFKELMNQGEFDITSQTETSNVLEEDSTQTDNREPFEHILDNPFSLAWYDDAIVDENYSPYDLGKSMSEFYKSQFENKEITESEYKQILKDIEDWVIDNNNRKTKLGQFLKNPNINKVDLDVEYTLDTQLLKIHPDLRFIKNKLLNNEDLTKEEIDIYAGAIPVQVKIKYEGNEYIGHIHDSNFPLDQHNKTGKPKMTDSTVEGKPAPIDVTLPSGNKNSVWNIQEFSDILKQLKSELYHTAFKHNQVVIGKVDYINGGFFIYGDLKPITDINVNQDPILKEEIELYTFNENYENSQGIVDAVGDRTSGAIYIKTKLADGRDYMSRLKVSNIEEQEAELIWQAYKEILSKRDNVKTITFDIGGRLTTGISPQSIINLLVYNRNFTEDFKRENLKNTKRYLGAYEVNGERLLHYGETEILTKNNMEDPDRKRDFINWITETKVRQIDSSKLNGSIFEGRSLNTESFTLLGQEFNEGSTSYNSFLFNGARNTPVLQTRLQDLVATQPTVRLDTDFNNTKVNENSEQFVFSELKEDSDKLQQEDKDDLFDDDDTVSGDDLGFKYRAEQLGINESSVEEVDNTQELEEFERMLPQIPTKELQGVMKLAHNKVAFGAFVTSLDVLSDFNSQFGVYYTSRQPLDNPGTLYHEAIHASMSLLLTESEKSEVLEAARNKWGNLKDKKLEEKIAEDFRIWKINQSTPKNIIERFFQRLMNLINNLLNRPDALHKLYNNLNSGELSSRVPVTDRIKKFSTDYSSSILFEDLDKYIDAFVGQVFRDNNLKDLETVELDINIDKFKQLLKFKEARDLLNSQYRIAQKTNNEDLQLKIKNTARKMKAVGNILEEDPGRIRTLVLDKLSNKYGLKPKDTTEEDDIRQENWDRSSFEISYKDNATTFTKLLIATLPKINEQGKIQIDLNTGLPQSTNYDATYNFIIENFSKAGIINSRVTKENWTKEDDIFNKQIKELERLAIYKPELGNLAKKLKSYDSDPNTQHLATQFSVAVLLSENKFEAMFITDGGEFNIGTLDSLSKESLIISEFENGFKESSLVYKYKGAENIDTLKLQEWLDDYDNFIDTVKKEKTNTDFSKNLDSTVSLLDRIGINVSKQALDYHLNFGLNTRIDSVNRNRQIVQFLKGEFSGIVYGTTAPNYNINTKTNNSLLGILNRQKEFNSFITKSINKDRNEELENKYKDKGSIIIDFSQEKHLQSLANSISFFRDDFSESTLLGAENNMIWKYSTPTYMHNFLTAAKNDPSLLVKLTQKVYHNKSLWLEKLVLNPKLISEFQLIDFNAVISNIGNKSTNQKSKDVDEFTEYLTIVHSTLNERKSKSSKSRFRLGSFADKSRSHVFMTGPTMVNGLNTQEVYKIFTNYYIGELQRMFYVENNKTKLGQIENYITKDNYKKSYLFPELSHPDVNIEKSPEAAKLSEYIFGTLIKQIPPNELNTSSLAHNPLFKQFLDKKINEIIKEESDYWDYLGIINENIDSQIWSHYESRADIIKDYVINSIVGNLETTKLFDGDPAFYKNINDFTKRTPHKQTTGTQPRITNKEDLNFEVVVAEDIEKPSDYITEEYVKTNLVPIVKQRYQKFLKEKGKTGELSEEQALSQAMKLAFGSKKDGGYKTTNRTDAAAYITLSRHKQIMRMIGRYKPNVHDAVYDRLENGVANFDDIQSLSLQPLKGVFYSKVESGKVMKPINLKYSQFPLIPQVVRGTELETVMNKMEELESETGNTTELVYKSGVKVGATSVTDITQPDFSFKGKNITVPNYDWKLQQDLPTKYWKKGETLDGSQYRKNIITNIFSDEDYDGLSGEEIIQELENLNSELSNRELNRLRDQLGIVDGVITNRDKFYEILGNELLKRGFDKNILLAVQNQLPLDTLPQYQERIMNLLSSMLVDRTVKLKMPGGAFIQVPEAMMSRPKQYSNLTAKERNDIIYITKDLQPALIKNGKFEPGTIFLPHKITSFVPKKILESKDWNQIKEYVPKELLGVIGYRIPNQPLASIDSLSIGGILPSYMGDTVVMYNDTTTKYGSDYDIDKTYIITPNYKVSGKPVNNFINDTFSTEREASEYLQTVEGYKQTDKGGSKKILQELIESEFASEETLEKYYTYLQQTESNLKAEYVKYDTGKGVDKNSKKAIQNRKIELYQKILSHPLTFLETVTPLDADWLKDDIYDLHNPSITTDTNFWTNKTQLEVKRNNIISKSGVGLTANVVTDLARIIHSMSYTRVRLGIGNKTPDGYINNTQKFDENGEYIFANINAFLSAYVDAAKDAFIVAGNYVSYTFNPAMVLFKAGVNREWINGFIGQPILKKLVQLDAINKSPLKDIKRDKTGKSMSALDQVLSDYGTSSKKYFYKLYGENGNKVNDNLSRLMQKWYARKTDLRKHIKTKQDLTQTEEIEILWLFKQLQDIGKEDSNATLASKADTVGHGKDMVNAITSEEKVRKVLNLTENEFEEFKKMITGQDYNANVLSNPKQIIVNFHKKFDNTALGTYFKNSVLEFQDMFENEFITYNTESKNVVKSIGSELGMTYFTDNEMLSSIYSSLFSYAYSSSPIANLRPNQIKNLFYNTETNESLASEYYKLISRVNEDKKAVLEDTIFPSLLKTFIGKSEDRPYFIYSNNTKNKDKDARDQFINTWLDMYKGEYGAELQQFSMKLLKYSFYTSGFQYGINSFHQLIPTEMLMSVGNKTGENLQSYIERLKREGIDYSNFREQMFRNNFNNKKIVPRIPNTDLKRIKGNKEYLTLTDQDSTSVFAGVDFDGNIVWKPFISMSKGKDRVDLFKFVGWKSVEGNKEAVYAKTYKLGVYDKGKRIVEYDMNTTLTNSIIPENNQGVFTNLESKDLYNSMGLRDNGVIEKEYDSLAAKADITSMDELASNNNVKSGEQLDLFENQDPFTDTPNTDEQNNC